MTSIKEKDNPHIYESLQFIEQDTHSFVIKLWLDEREDETGSVVWRGHITHVASRQRHYFDNVLAVNLFMMSYLQEMNIKIPIILRIYQWLFH